MSRRFLGLFIGAGFGMIFVLVNAGPPLDPAVSLTLRVLAVLAVAVLVAVAAALSRRPAPGTPHTSIAPDRPDIPDAPDDLGGREVRMDLFGPGYRIVVGAEVVALFAGFQVLRLIEAPTQAGVAWVATVVGLHFIAFLWVWRQPSILVPGVLLTAYGLIGLIMSAASRPEWVPIVSGVLSGITLLVCCLFVVLSELVASRTAEVSPRETS